ncbi:alpha/beta hydrolase [Lentzea roselyniae]|uniref:Alpha/beta hydrolase n=1 Tax=Lentzea roselyniae TaxID=531940 RepID=A0ABP7AWD5_9PSEU
MLGKLLLAVSLMMPVEPSPLTVHTGQIDGAEYRVEVPSRWNGTLLLYSHGTYPAGYNPPVEMASRPAARDELLARGYALAASRYRVPHGHAVPDALRDQPALVSWFSREVAKPRRVVAWGSSLGGLTSVMLGERSRFDGVLALCGALGGAVMRSNQLLDLGFVFRTLLEPSLELTRITDVPVNEKRAVTAIDSALTSAHGRARLALANAVAGIPAWSRVHEPRPTDVVTAVTQAAVHDRTLARSLAWGSGRADIETRAGGNPSWNTGVDYRVLLERSAQKDLVRAAYRDAGVPVEEDLRALAAAPRVEAEAKAVRWLHEYGDPTGHAKAPVVTLHALGDPTGVEHAGAYRARDVRRLYVNRAGHCMHTAAEELVALRVLEHRISSGHWPVSDLNGLAGQYGPEMRVLQDWTTTPPRTEIVAPGFVTHHPGRFPRP